MINFYYSFLVFSLSFKYFYTNKILLKFYKAFFEFIRGSTLNIYF